MGMFDSIKVDANNICNIAIPNHEYQTYNLENQMWVYRITKEGKLVVATTESDFGNECGVIRFRSSLARKSCVLHQINNNEFGGVFSMGGELSENGQWIDYLVLVHNSEIQYVTSYGEVIYSRDPESNGDFQEAIDKACTPDPLSIKQDIMFQQIMSSKHLLQSTPSKEGLDKNKEILNGVLAQLGYNPDGTVRPEGKAPPSIEHQAFLEALNQTLPGIVSEDGVIDVYALLNRGAEFASNLDFMLNPTKYPADLNLDIFGKSESHSAAASLMTAEDAPKAMERELQARKDKLLKGTDNGKS